MSASIFLFADIRSATSPIVNVSTLITISVHPSTKDCTCPYPYPRAMRHRNLIPIASPPSIEGIDKYVKHFKGWYIMYALKIITMDFLT